MHGLDHFLDQRWKNRPRNSKQPYERALSATNGDKVVGPRTGVTGGTQQRPAGNHHQVSEADGKATPNRAHC